MVEAEDSGFRPCKRCTPNERGLTEQHADAIARACRMIEEAEESMSLEALAAAVEISPHHFHHIFKAQVGVTPRAYGAVHQARRIREELGRADTITEAIYKAGFNANSRFYEKSTTMLGMTPTTFRAGGAGEAIRFAIGQSTLGAILVAATEKGICAIFLGDEPTTLEALPGQLSQLGDDAANDRINVRGDGAASYGSVMQVMGALSGAGNGFNCCWGCF